MKVTTEFIDHLQKEVDKLTPIQDSYTKKEIGQLIRDIKQLREEKLQFEIAKAEKRISKDKAEVVGAIIMLKQTVLGIATTKALSYLSDRLFKNARRNKKPKSRHYITLKRNPTF